jgi:hypothetical protein
VRNITILEDFHQRSELLARVREPAWQPSPATPKQVCIKRVADCAPHCVLMSGISQVVDWTTINTKSKQDAGPIRDCAAHCSELHTHQCSRSGDPGSLPAVPPACLTRSVGSVSFFSPTQQSLCSFRLDTAAYTSATCTLGSFLLL